jgi:hypothetical protein
MSMKQSDVWPAVVQRGFVLHYRPGHDNCCPGCGHSNWYVGRLLAECAMCNTVLPLRGSPYAALQALPALAA